MAMDPERYDMTRTVLRRLAVELSEGRRVGSLSPSVAVTLMAVLRRLDDDPRGRRPIPIPPPPSPGEADRADAATNVPAVRDLETVC
jgi:hypothetical protein